MTDNTLKVMDRRFVLTSIYFYISQGCNLRCRHCWISPKFQADGSHSNQCLPFDLFESILEQGMPMGVKSVKLTGGEPLLHPDILKILGIIGQKNLVLSLETNAVLCTPEIAERVAAIKKRFVSVSLDGANAETHEWVRGVKGCFNDAIEGIHNLVAVGVRPQIIMTVMRRNKDQIEDMVLLAESLGASSVKLNLLQPTERGKVMHEKGESLTIKEYVELGKWIERTLKKSHRIKIIYSHPFAFKPLGNIFGPSGDGCNICSAMGVIGVLADGSYALCGIGESVPELVFGHSARDRLEDVWINAPMLHQIREGLPKRLEGICHDCMMKNMCRGFCIAHNYYRSKNLWAPYWYCEESLNSGLFPESRRLQKDLLSSNEK